MIFVTIGTVFPFDRLIAAMDAYVGETGVPCVAQIGKGTYSPRHMDWHESLPGDAYKRSIREADVIVSHAGMGSIITALQAATPIVVLPRRFEAGEHTTDHQMATARWLEDKPGVFVAWDETALADRIAAAGAWSGAGETLAPHAPAAFTDRLAAQLKSWLQP
ncbi:MAG: glycosyltransferase [Pseudomonadota bacterium]